LRPLFAGCGGARLFGDRLFTKLWTFHKIPG
jgi:hypothetical protein